MQSRGNTHSLPSAETSNFIKRLTTKALFSSFYITAHIVMPLYAYVLLLKKQKNTSVVFFPIV